VTWSKCIESCTFNVELSVQIVLVLGQPSLCRPRKTKGSTRVHYFISRLISHGIVYLFPFFSQKVRSIKVSTYSRTTYNKNTNIDRDRQFLSVPNT